MIQKLEEKDRNLSDKRDSKGIRVLINLIMETLIEGQSQLQWLINGLEDYSIIVNNLEENKIIHIELDNGNIILNFLDKYFLFDSRGFQDICEDFLKVGWKLGISKNGYLIICKDKCRDKYVHRIIMGKEIKSFAKDNSLRYSDVEVHHINFDRYDLRYKNLEVMSHENHMKKHNGCYINYIHGKNQEIYAKLFSDNKKKILILIRV